MREAQRTSIASRNFLEYNSLLTDRLLVCGIHVRTYEHPERPLFAAASRGVSILAQ
jgi:hypothetical protein